LIPATHFYEPDKTVKPSILYLFHLKDWPLFAIAGLYDRWEDPKTGLVVVSYTILTVAANELVRSINHDRMPAILQTKEDEAQWVNPDIIEPEQIQPLLKPYPASEMELYEVPRMVWNYRLDNPTLIEPVAQETNR
jgi:putative SOS response-associated peptidase YedK